MPRGPEGVEFCADCSGAGLEMTNGFTLTPSMVRLGLQGRQGEAPGPLLGVVFVDDASGAEGGAVIGMNESIMADELPDDFADRVVERIASCTGKARMDPLSGCRALSRAALTFVAQGKI